MQVKLLAGIGLALALSGTALARWVAEDGRLAPGVASCQGESCLIVHCSDGRNLTLAIEDSADGPRGEAQRLTAVIDKWERQLVFDQVTPGYFVRPLGGDPELLSRLRAGYRLRLTGAGESRFFDLTGSARAIDGIAAQCRPADR